MRTIPVTCLLVFFLMPLSGSAQSAGIEAALQKGSARDLGVHFAKEIDISLPDLEDTYTPERAVEVLSAFFSREGVKGYKRVHFSAAQQGRAKYSIGDLYAAKLTYRITMYYNAQDQITEVRIVK